MDKYKIITNTGKIVEIISHEYEIENNIIMFYREGLIGIPDGIIGVFNLDNIEGMYNTHDGRLRED